MYNVKQIIGAMSSLVLCSSAAMADTCAELEKQGLTYDSVKSTIASVVSLNNGGLGFPMWLTLVDGWGTVCSVVNSLSSSQDASADIWLGSRNISAQKANAANAFSTGELAISTANLYSATQPSGSLYGLQASNPIDPALSYAGNPFKFGTKIDPMKGKRIGGINVFGGGLALYNSSKRKIGAIGVSGDTSCTDHVVAWKVRESLAGGNFSVKNVPNGISPGKNDAMIQDIIKDNGIGNQASLSGFGHPTCPYNPGADVSAGSIYGPAQ
ncbi:GlcG/HbpS family heme-binding protein [Methylococcus mesophilus]|uniref:GlcG/HbpS family heme-binding protein n=1 Tax=Methylococcus mesophilus TaxID=2993564 RepID=UPI00224AE964|nr:heme-binding protein [Methylococcus mesophilus]UZR27252.1 heme-binding protein [Methylococcus mesophilus]